VLGDQTPYYLPKIKGYLIPSKPLPLFFGRKKIKKERGRRRKKEEEK